MRILLLCFFVFRVNTLMGQEHQTSTETGFQVNKGRPIAETATPEEKSKQEYAQSKQDKGGCLWREEDWKKAETDMEFKNQMDRICEAEKLVIEKTNQDRSRYCKEPLKIDQRLSYVSRLNAIRLIKEGGVRHPNPHSAWYQGQPQRWFKDFFPAAAQVMTFERENMWGMGGGPDLKNIQSDRLASQATSSWIHSPGHHAPMVDCNNRYVGVGFFYDSNRSEWVGYMSFAENK